MPNGIVAVSSFGSGRRYRELRILEDVQTSDTPPSPQHKGRHWAIGAAIALILLGATFLLSQRSQKAGAEGGKGKHKGGRGEGGAIPVGVAPVQQGNMGVYINALGTVTPVYTVTVTSRVVGQLLSVHYREGQIVHKGDLLAEVDPRPYQAVVTQAEGQLARDRALLKNAYLDLDRYKMIYAQKAIPEQTLATQQATVEQNEGVVRIDQGNLDAAKVNYEYTRITAPIDGRVGLRLVDPGNIVQANGTAGLLTITQLQPITVIFTVAEDYLNEIVSQMRAGHKLRVDALDRSNQDELAQGTVFTIDNTIDVTTGTVKVRASFANRDGRLFPNEFVNARLLVKTLQNVNLIPTAAIQRNNDVAYVYVVNPDNTVQSRNINIATTNGNTAAATGVKPGEKLVVDGFDRLQDGVKISIRQSSAATENARNPQGAQTATEQRESGRANVQLNTNQQNPQQVNPK
jgi:membrane fusion protein, multidrug efflux system